VLPGQHRRGSGRPAAAGLLRPGNAGANTASDHITVLDAALAQIPDAHRHGTDILIRTDSAGGSKAFLTHLRNLRARGIQTFFSVGHPVTEPVRRAIRALPDRVWHPALEQDGSLRDGAEAAELTGMIDLTGYPDGTRVIVRRERPHPGARLSLFDFDEGMRHQVFLTDTPVTGGGTAQRLEARHRAHAGVEERIGLLVLDPGPAVDGELATAEPKKLRYRLRAARIPRRGRRLCLRISATWRWRHELPSAFTRLAALPRPAT